jgi:hypothetical protein
LLHRAGQAAESGTCRSLFGRRVSRKHGVPPIHQPTGQGKQTALSFSLSLESHDNQPLDQAKVGEVMFPFEACLCLPPPLSSSLTLVPLVLSPQDTTFSHHTNSILSIPAKTEQEGATALRPASPKSEIWIPRLFFPHFPQELLLCPAPAGLQGP